MAIDYGSTHPFDSAPFLAFRAGWPVAIAIVDEKPVKVEWRANGMGPNVPYTRDPEEGERKGWQRHDVFAALAWVPKGSVLTDKGEVIEPDPEMATAAIVAAGKANKNGQYCRCRIDVKGRLRFAFRRAAVDVEHWVRVGRTGTGDATEYTVTPIAEVSKDGAEIASQARKECIESRAK